MVKPFGVRPVCGAAGRGGSAAGQAMLLLGLRHGGLFIHPFLSATDRPTSFILFYIFFILCHTAENVRSCCTSFRALAKAERQPAYVRRPRTDVIV